MAFGSGLRRDASLCESAIASSDLIGFLIDAQRPAV